MGDVQTWRWSPRGPAKRTEGFVRGNYQTMKGERDSRQSAFDLFREQAIQDGLGDVIRELDAFFQERPVKPQAPQPG